MKQGGPDPRIMGRELFEEMGAPLESVKTTPLKRKPLSVTMEYSNEKLHEEKIRRFNHDEPAMNSREQAELHRKSSVEWRI